MLILTKDIVIADSLYAEKITFLPSLGHHSMDIVVGTNMGGLAQRSAKSYIIAYHFRTKTDRKLRIVSFERALSVDIDTYPF